MFFGTIPHIVSQYLFREFQKHNPKRIFVPFAGNFVVEQVAHKACPEAEIHSTDVSIYSNAIGHAINDQDFRLEIKKEVLEHFKSLARMQSPIEKAAVVIFFTEVSKARRKRDIPYYADQYRDAIMNQETYVAKILDKLTQFRDTSKFNYYGIDAVELLKKIRKGDMVFYDPPIDETNKDYEMQFASLKECVSFDEVPYTIIDDELKQAQLKYLNELGVTVYWRTNESIIPPENFEEVFNFWYKWDGRYCIYSNRFNMTFVGTWEPLKEIIKNIKIIAAEDEITEKSVIEIVQQPAGVGNHYRLLWVKKAQMTDSGWCFLIMIDGKLIGVLQLLSGIKFRSDLILINSDPAAPTSKYSKLSKLVLFLCSTREMIDRINDLSMWQHEGFTTRVFSNNPMSMKYRGIFDLTERNECKDGDYKFKLIYQNRKNIFSTTRDALAEWVKRYGKQYK